MAFLALLVALGLVVHPSASYAVEQPDEEPTPATGLGVVHGQVKSGVDDSYLNGVAVQALNPDSHKVVAEAVTGAESEESPSGYFELDLPPGTYELLFDPSQVSPGLARTSVRNVEVVPDAVTNQGDVILMPSSSDGPTDGPTEGPDQPLTAPVPTDGEAVIWGLVRKAGDPRLLGDVQVQAFPVDGDGVAEASSLTYEGYGYRNGVFALHVPPGTYDVRVTAPQGAEREDLEIGPVTVVADQVAFKGELILPFPPGLLVRVLDREGRRVDGALVQLFSRRGAPLASGTTRAGLLNLPDITATGRHRLVVNGTGFQQGVSRIRFDGDRKKVSVELRRAPVADAGNAVIWGVVSRAGARRFPQNLSVQAFDSQGGAVPAATSVTYGGYGYRGGVFALHVAPGDYTLKVFAPEGSDRRDLELGVTALPDTVHDMGFLRLQHMPGIRVRALNGVAGGAVDGADVRLTTPTGEILDAVTSADGRVTFDGVPVRGHHEVVVSKAGFRPVTSMIRLKKDRAKVRVFLAPQPVAAAGQSVIWGVVRKAGSRRYVGNALVQAFPAEGGDAIASSLTYEGYGYGNGVYALYVPPGGYTVRITPPDGATGEGLGLRPVTVVSDEVHFLGVRKLPFETVDVVTAPAVTPSSGLIEGDTVSVTPATYSDESAVAARSFKWFASYSYECGEIEDCHYRDQFARGPATQVKLPTWIEGARIVVVETVRTARGARLARSQSKPTDVVQGLPELVATTDATFDSIPTQGRPTTPTGVVWNVRPDEVEYRWSVDGSAVDSSDARLSAGGTTFSPAARDVGSWLSVEIVATKDGYTPGYAYAFAPRVKGVDERTRIVRVNLTKADGPDADEADDPVTDASLWLCGRNDCYTAVAREDGFESEVPTTQAGLEYQLSVYPYASNLMGTSTAILVDNGETHRTVTIKLEGIKPTPPSVTFPLTTPSRGEGADKTPMGFIGSPLTPFTARGCAPVENPTWAVTFANGSAPMKGTVQAGDVVAEAGSDPATVSYTVRIPELTSSGHATITTNFTCGEPISFTIYIDPSGYVADQFGRTIAGAEVTLLRANPGSGNFVVVPDRDASVMDPAVNDRNPTVTDGTGFFRWDVTEGDYRVSVTRASSGGAACAIATTPTMSVPPIRVDLLVKTECAGAAVPAPTTAPAVSGTREVGRTLSVSTGRWANGIVQTGIQWLRNGNPIDGATGAQYTLVQADAGQTVTARVTAQRPNYVQENGSGATVWFTPFTAAASGGGAVAAPNPGGGGEGGGGTPGPVVTNTAKPTVSGSATVAGSLTATPGTWSTEGLTFAYQWLRDGAPITGANGADYAPVVADLDKAISVKVTGSRTGSTPGTATSDPVTVGKGEAAENTGAKPLVTGTPEPGETLTVSDGGWNLAGLTFGFQWLRDGEPIETATAATYVVTEADLGSQLTARVTASKAGHEDGSVLAIGVTVQEGPVELADPKIKGKIEDRKVAQGTRGELLVRITSLGEHVPTGEVVVTVGKKSVTFVLTEADQGVLAVVLPKLRPGRYPIDVAYSGDELTEPEDRSFGTITVKDKKEKKEKGKGKRPTAQRIGGALL